MNTDNDAYALIFLVLALALLVFIVIKIIRKPKETPHVNDARASAPKEPHPALKHYHLEAKAKRYSEAKTRETLAKMPLDWAQTPLEADPVTVVRPALFRLHTEGVSLLAQKESAADEEKFVPILMNERTTHEVNLALETLTTTLGLVRLENSNASLITLTLEKDGCKPKTEPGIVILEAFGANAEPMGPASVLMDSQCTLAPLLKTLAHRPLPALWCTRLGAYWDALVKSKEARAPQFTKDAQTFWTDFIHALEPSVQALLQGEKNGADGETSFEEILKTANAKLSNQLAHLEAKLLAFSGHAEGSSIPVSTLKGIKRAREEMLLALEAQSVLLGLEALTSPEAKPFSRVRTFEKLRTESDIPTWQTLVPTLTKARAGASEASATLSTLESILSLEFSRDLPLSPENFLAFSLFLADIALYHQNPLRWALKASSSSTHAQLLISCQ